MIALHPKACKTPDDTFGQLPLHIACKFRAGTEVLKCLLDSFPQATCLADTAEGRLPLHYACVDGYPYDISVLIAAGKRALICKDASGKTPVDLVKESKSPHRARIIKRILKVAKDDAKKSKPREAREKQAPPTIQEPLPPEEFALVESLSELSDTTQIASNVSLKKPTKNAKSRLPSWVHGRKTKTDVDQSSVLVNNFSLEPLPFPKTEQNSSPVESRTSHKKNRSRKDLVPDMVSNETEMKPSPSEPRTGHNDRSQENSVPVMVSNETEKKSPPSKANSSSSKDRKKNRRHKNSVSEVTSSLGPRKSVDLSSLPVPASSSLELSLNESILEDTKESTIVSRQKKKGLATNTALSAFLSEEDKKCSDYEHDVISDPFPLPLTSPAYRRVGNSLPNLLRSLPMVSSDKMVLETSHLDVTSNIIANESRIIQTEHIKKSPHSCHPQSVAIPKASPNPFPNDGAVVALNAQLQSLELRKTLLAEECNHVIETILKKREKVQRDKGKLIEMKLKLKELEQLIDRQEEAVDFAENSIKLHEEILSDHKDKIRAVNQELMTLANKQSDLIQEKEGGEISSEAPSTSKSSASLAEASRQVAGNRFDEWESSLASF